jgi:hypothetical protein
MVELGSVTRDGLSWILQWLQVPLSGESEIVNADEVGRLHRDLNDRSAQDLAIPVAAAVAAASVAVQLFELLVERDPQGAGQYVSDLTRKLAAL